MQVDIKKWISKIIDHWWLFLLGLLITIPTGYFFLRYATLQYSTKAKLLIKDVGRSGNLSEANILLDQLGLSSGGKEMTNEIEILRSRPILTKTVDRIRANINYFRIGRVKDTELFTETPLLVDSVSLHSNRRSHSFYVQMDFTEDFEIRFDPDTEGEKYSYGIPFENDYGIFVIDRNLNGNFVPGLYRIVVWNAEEVAAYYGRKLAIEVVGAQGASSILELSLIDPCASKARTLIDTLIEVYNEEEINDDTKVFRNTISFIDDRVATLSADLNSIEGEIERFKRENEIITQDAVSSLDFTLTEIRSRLAALSSYEVEDQLLKTLEESLNSDQGERLLPSNITSGSTSLPSLISSYNQLLLESQRLSTTLTGENPILADVNFRRSEIRNLIRETIKSARANLVIPISQASKEIDELKRNMRSVPTLEQNLMEKLRNQSIKESLFLFLLQRREETALTSAVTSANTRVIESARSSGGPIYPRKRLVYLGSVLLGLFVPFLIVIGKSFFENTVDSEEVLLAMTSIPIVGRIGHNKGADKVLIGKDKRSVIAEMFRLLRTNLNYANTSKDAQVFLVTSSVSGEGKSVIAINLALTLAIASRKVAIVDLDLRKPRIAEYLGLPKGIGVTNFLVGEATADQIISESSLHECLSVVKSGPIPPNPAELILTDKMTQLMLELKKRFDYIIIDSPPLGVVTDALLLREHVANMLLVVRHKQTKKSMLKHLEEMYQKGELVNPLIVLNDIKPKRGYYGYGGYNYGYGKGYYTTKS